MSEKSVFISYRRESSEHLSELIFNNLKIRGYDVFMNTDTLVIDAVNTTHFNEIANRPHFIVLLSSGSLEPCIAADDLFRREIEYAIDLQKNVIPLFEEGFNFKNYQPYLTDKLNRLQDYDGPRLFNDYFEAALDDLESRFLNKLSRKKLEIGSYLILNVTPPYQASDELENSAKSKVQIVLDGDIANFDRGSFINALSRVLGFPKNEMTLLRVAEGRVLIQVELPTDAAQQLYDLLYEPENQLHNTGQRTVTQLKSSAPMKTKQHRAKPAVLIIDDEEGFLQILQVVLKRAGYLTYTAKNGAIGLEIVYHERPEVVILDDMMAHMSGAEVCIKIKNDPEISDTLVIMHGEGAKLRDAAYINQLGADGVLFKPSLPHEIIAMIDNLGSSGPRYGNIPKS